ncbi:MAG: LCP family protein, partial [Eubacteriales bacterium]
MSRFDFSDNFVTRYFDWRRDFYSNLTTGQKIRHRLLQAMVVVSLCIIVGYITLNKTVSLPDVPSLPDGATNLGGNTSASQLDEDGVLSFDGAEYPSVALSGRREGVYTFLILGIDVTSDATDTIILLTYDTINKTVDGISLLRDTMVNVGYANKKLTHVYGYADGSDPATQVQKGTTAVKNHVANMTGIYPDFYVMLEWEAVGELVDAIGGVEFEVPFNMNYTDPYQNLYINQAAGLRVLDGQDAMEVIRYRKDNSGNQIGDTGRTEIQQDFLMALAKTCLTPEILLKVPAISQIFMDNVTTDLTVGNILAFAQQAQGMDFNSGITLSSMPYVDMNRWEGLAYVGVNSSAMVKLVNQGLNPYVDDIQVSDLKVMVSRSDGSFGVTYSALVDSDLAYPPESDED